ncbi:hydrolase TatD [Chromatiales bacterium (ex Bugula neritina AB1)]|nr:hydrolase TatD [Chromatiales bacterium (ex Bugula neritina AB1)]
MTSADPLIDIGANLTHESFNSDLEAVLNRAREANVSHMVVTGSDIKESISAIKLASCHPDVLSATAGIHPHYASQFNQEAEQQLQDLLNKPEVCAIGETGLDFFRDISPREQQQESFIAHLELAAASGKPLFLHQRNAHDAFVALLKEYRHKLGNVVVHCFTDTREALHDYLDLECHIGITGWICDERRGKALYDCVGDIPLRKLMIETDCPYLMPRNIKPKPKTRRNEPCMLPMVLQTVTSARLETQAQIAAATTENALEFFELRPN